MWIWQADLAAIERADSSFPKSGFISYSFAWILEQLREHSIGDTMLVRLSKIQWLNSVHSSGGLVSLVVKC